MILGEPESAAETLAGHIQAWAPGQERDHAVALTRWLQPLAASGDCQTALEQCDGVLRAYETGPFGPVPLSAPCHHERCDP